MSSNCYCMLARLLALYRTIDNIYSNSTIIHTSHSLSAMLPTDALHWLYTNWLQCILFHECRRNKILKIFVPLVSLVSLLLHWTICRCLMDFNITNYYSIQGNAFVRSRTPNVINFNKIVENKKWKWTSYTTQFSATTHCRQRENQFVHKFRTKKSEQKKITTEKIKWTMHRHTSHVTETLFTSPAIFDC